MKVMVSGSTGWPSKHMDIIRKALWKIGQEAYERGEAVFLVTGGAPLGADRYAASIGRELGFTVIRHPAQWQLHDKAAGPIRNREMWEKEHRPPKDPVDRFLAFPTLGSVGTWDMIDLVTKNPEVEMSILTCPSDDPGQYPETPEN